MRSSISTKSVRLSILCTDHGTTRSWFELRSLSMEMNYRVVKLIAIIKLAALAEASGHGGRGSLRACAGREGWEGDKQIVIENVVLSPPIPRAGLSLDVQIWGRVHQSYPKLDLRDLRAEVGVEFCNRLDDCLLLHEIKAPLCELANISEAQCVGVEQGTKIVSKTTWRIPDRVIRGSYNAYVQIRGSQQAELLSCYTMANAIIAANLAGWTRILDFRDAFVAFGVAASSSRALGKLFPFFSYGLLPQISGFLMMGVVVGPYVTNLVSHYHIFLIGKTINRISLSFIAGAAGAEIFLPELQGLITQMVLQVACISSCTIMICSFGLITLSFSGAVALPMITGQASFSAQVCVSMLAATLMTARSPASAIAIIAEMEIADMKISKIVLGVTVLGDIVVLVLFALASNLTRVVVKGGTFGSGAIVGVFVEILASCLLGALASQALRLVIPRDQSDSDEPKAATQIDKKMPAWIIVALRGAALIGILFCAFMIADKAAIWSEDAFHLEPLLVCTVASCICGHDEKRRQGLGEALGFWTPIVLLPFFTLAGACLQLFGLMQVFCGAIALVVLRTVSIAVGSFAAGNLSVLKYPELGITSTAVRYTWMTLLAQAGVTLGLVLEVEEEFQGRWCAEFSTLIIGVVVLNQLLGPVLCRVGLHIIVPTETDRRTPPEGEVTDDISPVRSLCRTNSPDYTYSNLTFDDISSKQADGASDDAPRHSTNSTSSITAGLATLKRAHTVLGTYEGLTS